MMARRNTGTKKGIFRHSLEAPVMLNRVPKSMKELRKELSDFSGAFREMPPVLARNIRENIDSRGSRIGKSWKPAKEKYDKRKRREGKGGRQLDYIGTLRKQLTSPTGAKYSISKRRIVWGTTKKTPYARAVHFKKLPFFELNERTKAKLQSIMDDHALVKLDKSTKALWGAGSGK